MSKQTSFTRTTDNKRFRVLYLFVTMLATVCPFITARQVVSQSDTVTLQHTDQQVWVVLNNLPDYVDPPLIYDLYAFLSTYVTPHEESPLYDLSDEIPLVIRFVPEDATALPFQWGLKTLAV